MFENGVQYVELSTYSHDFNPIENLFSDFERRVENRFAQNAEELRRYIQEEWDKTDKNLCIKLVNSMKERCQQAINNHGYKTRF